MNGASVVCYVCNDYYALDANERSVPCLLISRDSLFHQGPNRHNTMDLIPTPPCLKVFEKIRALGKMISEKPAIM